MINDITSYIFIGFLSALFYRFVLHKQSLDLAEFFMFLILWPIWNIIIIFVWLVIFLSKFKIF